MILGFLGTQSEEAPWANTWAPHKVLDVLQHVKVERFRHRSEFLTAPGKSDPVVC